MADEIVKEEMTMAEETGMVEETAMVEEPVEKQTWKEFFLGSPDKYNYCQMCIPTIPRVTGGHKPMYFYGKDEPLPLVMSLLMGLQHAFAMVGGLITPPYVIFRFTIDFNDIATQQYAISAALIVSGISTIVNVTRFKVPFSKKVCGRQLYLGTGVLSVMGTSFTFLPIYEISIRQMMVDGDDGFTAFGRMLGTTMCTALLELALSFMPRKWLKTLFPPLVCSVTVMLIGLSLVGSGIKSWGGGVVCAEMIWKEHEQAVPAVGIDPIPSATCQNGDVFLGYGSPEFVGLGASVLFFLVFIEIFGSTFMKNCNVMIALLFGYMVAAFSNYNGLAYVDSSKIADAEPITFLWTTTFPLGLYGPAVIPLLIGFMVTTVETVGDVTATYEASELETTNQRYDESIQGGLAADSLLSIFGALATTMPMTTFSQNNGVIALTKCAARRSGLGCGFWLIVMGVFSKIAGVITSIPDCVIGGMTIFLFANVFCSGVTIASSLDLHSRRIRFIVAMSMAIGVGVSVWPFAFQDMRASSYTANFWRCADCSDTMKGVRNGVLIFLSTGYCVGTVVAMLLNLILPSDAKIIRADKHAAESEVSDDDGDVKPDVEAVDATEPMERSEVIPEKSLEFSA